MSSDKQSWPELIGKPVDEAIEIIKKENSNLDVIKLKEGSPVTEDFRSNRVRVFFNKDGNVSSTPTIA
ncbi:hypothetical protein I4U23_026233 [Adineta vaga]|nr:hypothetical protein I4U23_026233 [Adineta vaga]